MSPVLPPTVPARILLWRCLSLLIPACLLTFVGLALAWNMMGDLPDNSLNILDMLAFTIFAVLFAMLATTSWAMVLGLGLWVAGRRLVPLEKEALAIPQKDLAPSLHSRTALLVPAYHEDPTEVFARVRAMHDSLAALQSGMESDVDIFILSDSHNPDAIAAEAIAYQNCLNAIGKRTGPAIYYRRRENNTGYKVGNIKEFCTRWGHAYEHMLILDADSLMSGETIRRLITLMERHPQVGLLQTTFVPIGRETLFCRIMQFSARLYLKPASMGLEFWQGRNANYWGHNAIIRTRTFAETCGLPELPGKAPLGGRILSHDIVEAAFIARGGWEAWLLPNLPGTYEELPTNLIDYMQRDRRWCAGNLQHQHIIRADGIAFGNRLHMVLGIMSYATGPLWLGFIGLALIGLLVNEAGGGMQLATAGFFTSSEEGKVLFRFTMALLFLPKLASLLFAMSQKDVRKSFGGTLPMLASAILEQVFVMLLQPIAMLFYTTFVIKPLLGQVVRWEAQPRSERGISWHEAFLRTRNHLLFGVSLVTLFVSLHSVATALGLLPVLIGLLFSPVFTVMTSRAELGRLTRRWKLFLTVDEIAPSPEISAAQKFMAEPVRRAKVNAKLPALPENSPCVMPVQELRYPRHSITLKKAPLFGILEENPIRID